MKIFKTILALAVIFLIVVFVFPSSDISDELTKLQGHVDTFVENLKSRISAPGPLRIEIARPGVPLTRAGVITATNEARTKNGEAVLTENAKLNAAAGAKLSDMFRQQYFEHISPSGVGPGDLAEAAGYDYAVVGENLALGNFDGDQDLVGAWMNSPGHRENILNPKFTEIGVAVGKGTFEGKSVWLAVQEFGKPAASCPLVDQTLKQQITALQTQLNQEEQELEAEQARLNEVRQSRDPSYNDRVTTYNERVRHYNALLAQTREHIREYNAQVAAYNACVE